MENLIAIQARAYPVTVRDERTGTQHAEFIVLDKQQLQAAQTVGQDVTALLYRMFNRKGYRVLSVGKPVKKELAVDLTQLYHSTV